MADRSHDGMKWYKLQREAKLSYTEIVDVEKHTTGKIVSRNIVAGAIFRYREKQKLKPLPSPLGIVNNKHAEKTHDKKDRVQPA